MAMDDFQIELVAGLDGAKSKSQLNSDIEALKKQLNNVEIEAKIGKDVVTNITKQLNAAQISLKNVEIDQSAINKMVSQINSALSGININLGEVVSGNGQQIGRQFGQQVKNGIQSAIQKSNFKTEFGFSANDQNNVAKQAQKYFQGISDGIVTVQERMHDFDGNTELNGFTVNIKNAKGEVESLNYALKNLVDDNGNITGQIFKYTRGSINDSGAIKQIKEIENAFSDFSTRLAKFKSTNSEILSGLDQPLKIFENKLTGLKNGANSVDDVTMAFNLLNVEAAKITQNFSKQLSPIDRAVAKIAQGDESIKSLTADFKGLNNAPKEINKELTTCVSLLQKVKDIEKNEGRTENWSKAYKEWEHTIDSVSAKLSTLKKEQSNSASTQIFNTSDFKSNNIAYMSKVYNTIEKQMVEIDRLASKNNWTDVKVSGIEQADGKIQQLTLTVRDAEGALKQFNMQREKLQGNGKVQAGLVQTGDVKVLETATQYAEKLANIKLAIGENGKTTTAISTLGDSFKKLGLSSDEIKQKLENVHTEFETLQNYVKNGASGTQITTQFEKLNSVLNQTQNDLRQTRSEMSVLATDQSRLSKAESLQKWADNNTKAMKTYGNQVTKLINQLKNLNEQMTVADSKQLSTQISKIKNSARTDGLLGMSGVDKLKNAWSKFGGWSLATGSLMSAVNGLRQIPQEVTNIDTAMTSLYKVTDETDKKYQSFLSDTKQNAQELGRTVSGLIDQTAEWAKLGYSIDDASKLAQTSSIYSNVGEVDDTTAVQDLVSTMKAFNIEATNSINIVDSMNKLGNEFATDSKSLGEGLRNSASAMAMAGNDLNQTLALLTGGGEITQNVGELGNMLKVASLRLASMKGKLEEINEDYQDIESVSKNQTQIYNLTKGEVNILDEQNGKLKDTYTILEDVSDAWKDVDELDKSTLLELMFGKQRANQGAAIIQAFQSGQVQKAYEASSNADGSAQQEQERWLNSIDAKAKQLDATFQTLSSDILNSETIKFVVDGCSKILNGFDQIIKISNKVNTSISNAFGVLDGGNSLGGSIGAITGLLTSLTGNGKIVLCPSL